MPECDWAGYWGQAGVASLRPDPDLDLDLRVSTSHRGSFRRRRLGGVWGVHHTQRSAASGTALHCIVFCAQCTPSQYLAYRMPVIYSASYDPDCSAGPGHRSWSFKEAIPPILALPACLLYTPLPPSLSTQ